MKMKFNTKCKTKQTDISKRNKKEHEESRTRPKGIVMPEQSGHQSVETVSNRRGPPGTGSEKGCQHLETLTLQPPCKCLVSQINGILCPMRQGTRTPPKKEAVSGKQQTSYQLCSLRPGRPQIGNSF